MNKAVPVLGIDDYEQAKSFYVDKLGFEITFEARHEPGFPVHMGVECGELFMHLSEHAKGHPGSGVYLFVDDIEAWYKRLTEHGVEIAEGPVRRLWGNTEMQVTDPFRNLLTFSQVDTHEIAPQYKSD